MAIVNTSYIQQIMWSFEIFPFFSSFSLKNPNEYELSLFKCCQVKTKTKYIDKWQDHRQSISKQTDVQTHTRNLLFTSAFFNISSVEFEAAAVVVVVAAAASNEKPL